MTAYADHHTLTPERRRALTAVVAGERVELQRIRVSWFTRNGYWTLHSRRDPARKPVRVERRVVLTDKAWAALAMTPPENANEGFKIFIQGTNYVPEPRRL